MAKLSGLGMSGVTVQDAGASARDLTNDIEDLSINTPIGTYDVTGLDKSAFERLAGLEDAKLSFTMAFNPAANKQHAVFSGSKAVARQVVIPFPAGGGTGATSTVTGLITSYNLTRSNNGNLQAKATIDLSNGTATAWS